MPDNQGASSIRVSTGITANDASVSMKAPVLIATFQCCDCSAINQL